MNLTAQVAERYVRDAMALDPVSATLAGISGFDDQMADLTPDGFEARAELDRRTIAAIREVAPASEPEQVARTAMLERLGLAVEQYDAGETTSEISVIASWMHSVRAVVMGGSAGFSRWRRRPGPGRWPAGCRFPRLGAARTGWRAGS